MSVCLAQSMPASVARLDAGYVSLIEFVCETGDLIVGLYYRSHDCKSRMLCRTIRPAHLKRESCEPLISLVISRSGPFLKLFAIYFEPPKLWACLRFSDYEGTSMKLLYPTT